MILPACFKPMEDEFIYGWLLRIADANGFLYYPDNVNTFTNFYFYNVGSEINKDRGNLLEPVHSLEIVCRNYGDIEPFPDVETVMKKMTTFCTLMPFMSEEEQTRRGMLMLRKKPTGILKMSPLHGIVKSLHVCPQCMNEDILKYEERYYHTWHQLPGVKVCPIHQCKLMKIQNYRNSFLNHKVLPKIEEESLQSSFEIEFSIAKFMYGLYRNQIGGDLGKTISAVKRELESKGYSVYGNHEDIAADMETAGAAFRPNMDKWIHKFLIGSESSLSDKIKFCVFLFGDYENFLKKIEDIGDDQKENRWLLKSDFEDLSDTNSILKVQCKKCGNVFHTLPSALSMGFECPKCEEQLSEKQFLEKRLKCLGDGNYIIASELKAGDKVKIKHETCGKIAEKTIRSIMYGRRVCHCELCLSRAKIQKRIDGGLNRFELLSYREKNNKGGFEVLIKDKICGESFTADFAAFQRSRRCRVCEGKIRVHKRPNKINEADLVKRSENFMKNIQLLTGDEYELTGNYINLYQKCTIKHIKCGTTTEMLPISFLLGRRCPLCYSKLNVEELEKMIYECTEGYYKVVGRNKSCLSVECPDGSVVKKSTTYLFAELERPGKSEIFDHRIKKPVRKESASLKVYQDIKNACGEGKIWAAKDYVTEMGRSNLNNRISYLLRLGVIKRVSPGKYMIVEGE